MELNKKILSAYLPFDVKIQGNTHGQIETLSGIKGETLFIESSKSLYPWCDICEIKPILRPLSDLTKDIEVNREKFVPIKEYNYLRFDEISTFESGSSILEFLRVREQNVLLELHFDIFGLIDNGLAIDINTI